MAFTPPPGLRPMWLEREQFFANTRFLDDQICGVLRVDDDRFHECTSVPVPGRTSGTQVGDILRAACMRGPLALPDLPASVPMRCELVSQRCSRTSHKPSFAQEVNKQKVTTLQCYGLHPCATVESLVHALNAEGLGGCYNYVIIPRRMEGDIAPLGFAFINFTSAEAAAFLAQQWEGERDRHECLPKVVRFKAASRQGYQSYVSEKALNKYQRIRKQSLWPLVMTEDGRSVVFGSPAAIAAAMEWGRQEPIVKVKPSC
mmetsp:Transcript_31396/g.57659  ORF Transcript_31396/g.57659 Transcript_31396/m.57659 type:complete len:259 (+) Transcript_31396:80-856(+)